MKNKIIYILLVIGIMSLVWPFSWDGINSQIIGLLILIFIFTYRKKIKFQQRDLLIVTLIIPLLIIATYHFIKNKDDGMLLIILYMLKIPLFYFISKFTLNVLFDISRNHHNILFLICGGFLVYIIFIIIQLLNPELNELLMFHLEDDRVAITRANNMSGHSMRFLGWNGFLYASHAVGLATTSIILLTWRYKIASEVSFNKYYISFFLELSCLAVALLAGRTALPIALLYVILLLIFQKKIVYSLFYLYLIPLTITLTLLIIQTTDDGAQLLVWLLEPISNLLEGKIQSNSVDDLNATYHLFFDSLKYNEELSKNLDFGLGIYNRSNSAYEAFGLHGSDSGIIRSILAIGVIGTFYYIMLFSVFIYYSFKISIKRNTNFYYFLLMLFMFLFGIIFFYKSEWLYQNYFLFFFFFMFNIISCSQNNKDTYV